ncbi:hypothetical protein H0A36_15995 [Endozoicomonas sp. SM1973]|uniref:Uncharacterized protein n=1 Tax=Spartinivicinus marinus TaxID=2994442 RepID=A0A853I0L3_9GAMM|nr:hypothetical protein [Spartinivicinus marinus]MCX4029810.1 hypothetical protein [Spartinivicinus marinus]NYZ67520.1 hypothetical protein [Spartinivicinus marinus]
MANSIQYTGVSPSTQPTVRYASPHGSASVSNQNPPFSSVINKTVVPNIIRSLSNEQQSGSEHSRAARTKRAAEADSRTLTGVVSGSNIERGAQLTVSDRNGTRVVHDRDDGHIDGVIHIRVNPNQNGDYSIKVDNDQAPDFSFTANAGNTQVQGLKPGIQDTLSHAPAVSITNNGSGLQIKANFSTEQIALFKTITNGNLIGNLGSSASDPRNQQFEQQLLAGTADPYKVSQLLNRVDSARRSAIMNVNERLFDVVNNLRGLEGVNLKKPLPTDSSTVASQKLFEGMQQLSTLGTALQSTYGDLQQALKQAKDYGVSDDYLASGLTALEFNGKTGEAALQAMETRIKAAADNFFDKATDLVKSGDQLIGRIKDHEAKKQMIDTLQTVLGFVTLSFSFAGAARSLFKGAAGLLKASKNTKLLKEGAESAKKAADEAQTKLAEAIKNTRPRVPGSARYRPDLIALDRQREKTLGLQKIAGDAQKAFNDGVKAVSKKRNALVDSVKTGLDSATSTASTINLTIARHRPGVKQVDDSALVRQADQFMSTGDSAGLRESASYQRFHNTFVDMYLKYAVALDMGQKVEHHHAYGEYDDGGYDMVHMPPPEAHKRKRKEMEARVVELNNQANPGEFYYLVDQRKSRGFWRQSSWSLDIIKIDTGAYMKVPARAYLHGNNVTRDFSEFIPDFDSADFVGIIS